MSEVRFQRQVSYRATCTELSLSRTFIRGGMDKTPNLLVTPLGTEMNRVMITGILGEITDINGSGFYTSEIEDITGSIRVQAGQYDPAQALRFMKEAEPGTPVLILAKTDAWEPEDGSFYPRLRVQNIRQITPQELKLYQREAIRNTLRRFRDSPDGDPETKKELLETLAPLVSDILGTPVDTPKLPQTPSTPLPPVGEETAPPEAVQTTPEPTTETTTPEPTTETAQTTEASTTTEEGTTETTQVMETPASDRSPIQQKVFEYIQSHPENSKGVEWNAVLELHKTSDFTLDEVENAIIDLLAKKDLSEPVLGRVSA